MGAVASRIWCPVFLQLKIAHSRGSILLTGESGELSTRSSVFSETGTYHASTSPKSCTPNEAVQRSHTTNEAVQRSSTTSHKPLGTSRRPLTNLSQTPRNLSETSHKPLTNLSETSHKPLTNPSEPLGDLSQTNLSQTSRRPLTNLSQTPRNLSEHPKRTTSEAGRAKRCCCVVSLYIRLGAQEAHHEPQPQHFYYPAGSQDRSARTVHS